MSFISCLKNKFNCEETYKQQYNNLTKIKDQVEETKGTVQNLIDNISKLNISINEKNQILELYKYHHNMWNDIPPIEKVGKPISQQEVVNIFETSWDCEFKYNKSGSMTDWGKPHRNIEAHFITGTIGYRIPMVLMREICTKSLVSEWTHGLNDNGPYACNDFSFSFFSEFLLAPKNYWKTVIGVLRVTGHRINCFIPSEEDKVYYIEPQTDKIWFPDLRPESNEKKPFHVIF